MKLVCFLPDSYLYTAYSNVNGKGKMYKVNIDFPNKFLYMGVNIETCMYT